MRLFILSLFMIQSFNISAKDQEEIYSINKVKSTEVLEARMLYASKLDKTLDMEIAALKKQHELDELKGVKKDKKKKPKPVRIFRPNIKVLALYEKGALISYQGFTNSVKIGDRVAGATISKITPSALFVSYRNKPYRYTVK